MSSHNKRIEQLRNSNVSEENLDLIFKDQRHLVNGDVEKIRNISMKILSMIDHLSKEHDFNYFMSYGTLIGVIRHQGFIPWDDDIDIMMTKQDVEKLIQVSYKLPDSINFFAQGLNFLKVMDKYSKISIDGQRGVAVDIFVLDGADEKFSFVNVHNQKRIHLSKADIFPLSSLPFENTVAPVPHNYHQLLTNIYGDYMQLPPVEKQVSHHVNSTSVNIKPFPKINASS